MGRIVLEAVKELRWGLSYIKKVRVPGEPCLEGWQEPAVNKTHACVKPAAFTWL